MTLDRFFCYVGYSQNKPAEVKTARWNGMLKALPNMPNMQNLPYDPARAFSRPRDEVRVK